MPRRKTQFINGEYYHIYNRGVGKRDIVSDTNDKFRFLHSLNIFNTTESVGSVFDYNMRVKRKKGKPGFPLVEIAAFNLLDNHYHLVLKQLVDGGISMFMKSLGGGYAKYYNEKYDRVGPLFQGPFKASSFLCEDKLVRIVAYVNLNHVVHKFGTSNFKWGMRSSWEQYTQKKEGVTKATLLKKFNKNKSIKIINEIIKERETGFPFEEI
jgi:REP element-mobilizing transposase RayT